MANLDNKIYFLDSKYDAKRGKYIIDINMIKYICDLESIPFQLEYLENSKSKPSIQVPTNAEDSLISKGNKEKQEEKLNQETLSCNTSDNIKVEDLKKTKQSKARLFREKIKSLIHECMIKGPKPWQNPNCVIGEAPIFDICYDKNKIEEHLEDIKSLLSELKDAEYFDDLRYFNNFEVWTVLRQQLSFLMTLANAAKLITFEKELNNNNPKITLKKIN